MFGTINTILQFIPHVHYFDSVQWLHVLYTFPPFHCRDDEDHDVTSFPVVKETGGQLLETGINTFQKTLLLKKEVEVAKVDAELEKCRQRFRQKMEELQQRKLNVQKKRQMVKKNSEIVNKYN